MAWPLHIVAAGGYVFDGKGNILLVKTHTRGWDCTGGQVEEGETLEEGVLREIMEESGVVARVIKLAGVYSNVGRHRYEGTDVGVPTKVMFDFICEYVSGDLRPSEETSEVMWVPREKTLDYVTAPAMRYRFGKILAFDGRVTYGAYVSKPEFKLISERMI
jgi:ADP-ribose pyrophosphatase YjhB (NUDIX family)